MILCGIICIPNRGKTEKSDIKPPDKYRKSPKKAFYDITQKGNNMENELTV